jgi:RNA polymerase sigma-70 factor (ECF subfamily)
MTADPSFRRLIRRVRAGDQEAAAELVRRYEPEIRRAVRMRLTDPRLRRTLDSLDICQSVLANFFVRVAGGQFDLDEPGQLVRLLVTMARNKLLDHARKLPQRSELAAEPGVLEGAVGREESPSQVLARQELLQAMRRQLTDEERHLAEQRARGRGWREIAATCGGSPDALRKKLARALDRACRRLGLDPVKHE